MMQKHGGWSEEFEKSKNSLFLNIDCPLCGRSHRVVKQQSVQKRNYQHLTEFIVCLQQNAGIVRDEALIENKNNKGGGNRR